MSAEKPPVPAPRRDDGASPSLRQGSLCPLWVSGSFLYLSLTTTLLLAATTGMQGGSAAASIRSAALLALGAFMVTALLSRLGGHVLARWTCALLVGSSLLAYAVPCAIDLLAVLFFEQRISVSTVCVLLETNPQESFEFLTAYADAKLVLAALFLLAPLLLRRVARSLPARAVRLYLAALLLALVTPGLASPDGDFRHAYDPGKALLDSFLAYRAELDGYRRVSAPPAGRALAGKVAYAGPAGPAVEILLLGESTSRNHMALYGYGRDTSPALRAMGDELHVFRDVISPHSHTMPALRKLFTFANLESKREWYHSRILMELYEAAGYRTYWIGNQEMYGIWSSTTRVIANRARVRLFHETLGSKEALLSRRLDGELLPYLDRVLRDDAAPRKFVVVHLKGTHAAYRSRYPEAFERFRSLEPRRGEPPFMDEGRRRTVNEYDNAVLYNDHVVAQVIGRVKQQGVRAFVLYLSDHAEEVYDQRDFAGHREIVGSRFMVEIPFVLWLSDAYREANRALADRIGGYLGRPYMSDDLIHTLLDLSSLRCPGWEPGRSVVNAAFDAGRKRRYGGWDYEKDLRTSDSVDLVRRNRHKVWAHRVNSTGKLALAAARYAGVELDLVFRDDERGRWFDVNHPPRESIGLSLDTYLDSIPRPSRLQYWLDIKNLQDSNREAVAHRLEYLFDRHGLEKDEVIVESKDFAALSHLSASGFRTTYYLPWFDPAGMPEEEQEARAAELVSNARTARVRLISCPEAMLALVGDRVLPKLPGTRLLMWFPERRIDVQGDAIFIQQKVDDDRVAVVLVGFPTKHDR